MIGARVVIRSVPQAAMLAQVMQTLAQIAVMLAFFLPTSVTSRAGGVVQHVIVGGQTCIGDADVKGATPADDGCQQGGFNNSFPVDAAMTAAYQCHHQIAMRLGCRADYRNLALAAHDTIWNRGRGGEFEQSGSGTANRGRDQRGRVRRDGDDRYSRRRGKRLTTGAAVGRDTPPLPGPGRAAERRGPGRPAYGRREPHQMAPRAHHLVLRDVRVEAASGGLPHAG